MIELLQFRFSPYNEKVRWALDLKRVPHTRRSLLPGPHMGQLRPLTGRSQTPVLVVDGQALDGSAAIVRRLEALYPEPPLLPADERERAAVQYFEQRFDDDLTPRGRRAVLAALLRTPMYWAKVFGDGRAALAQAAYATVIPLAAPLVRKGNGIRGQASVDDGMAAFQEGLDLVAREAVQTGYLVGGRFTLADLTAAATLVLCMDIPGTPMSRPQPLAAPTRAIVERFAGHPALDWVRGIYARHRGAVRDFDGASPGPA